ncbi:MAG: GreA/GreB family elongation factor [Thermoanaerobaculia bacterium]
MAITKDVRKYIEAGDFEALEEAWLARLAEAPKEADFFVSAARQLKGSGEEQRAASLLELADDELVSQRLWATRLEMLRGAGELMHDPGALHDAIVESLGALYAEHSAFEGLAGVVGLHRATEDIPKTWEKVGRVQALLAFDLGTIVWMKDKGAGRVAEVNLELESFKVDFEKHPGLRVGFRAAPKLLEVLPAEHILHRKLERPEELTTLKSEDPSALLLAVLASHDGPLTAGEIRDALHGIVEPAEWSSWWNAARRSPRVLAEGSGSRQKYRAVASEEDADASILEAFRKASPEHRLELFRRHGTRGGDLFDRLADGMRELAVDPDLPTALLASFALADAGHPVDDADERSPAARLVRARDPIEPILSLSDRTMRERAYRLLAEVRSDAGPHLAAALEGETETRSLDVLKELLDGRDPEAIHRFEDAILAQPRKSPAALVWLAERAIAEPELRQRGSLRLLQHVLASLLYDDFKDFRPRMKKLADESELLPGLLDSLESAQAERAEQALTRAHLEDWVRAPLIDRLHMRFAELRSTEQTVLYALPESITARREEMRKLKEEEIPANRRAIEEARELGDLRENFEYKSARQRHEYLSSRLASLDRDLSMARPIDLGRDDDAEIRIASTVTIAEDGEESALTILGPWESDPEGGVISYDSDLGRALLGASAGETVSFGKRTLEIRGITPYRGNS